MTAKKATEMVAEIEEKFTTLQRRLSEATRECNRVQRQNLSLQKENRAIKDEIKKIKKLAECGIDYTQEIIDTCDKILK